jgi:hypothetical protein
MDDVNFGLRTYEKVDNTLEHTDEKGFKTQIIFDKCTKSKEQLDKELIEILYKH